MQEYMREPDRNISDIKQAIINHVDSLANDIIAVSKYLYDNPETAYEEYKACRLLSDFLIARGFAVETGVGEIETAFLARPPVTRSQKPTVAFLAEYDALPKIGHGCGHNLIAAAAIGAFTALHRAWPDSSGTILLVGTPAEEGGGGKARMAASGVFAGIDMALMFHPGHQNRLGGNSLGRIKAKVEFFGRTAHASASPEMGVNALDAMVCAYNNISAFRQQMASSGRIHGIITDGGDAPNVIPDYAAGLFYIRALNRDYLETLFKRFEDCCHAAAQATGCNVKINVLPPSLEPMKRNPVLEHVWEQNLIALGLEPCYTPNPSGSTDLGNISQIMPVIQPYLALCGEKTVVHTAAFAEATQSDTGRAVLVNAAKLLAMTAYDYVTSKEIQASADRAFSEAS
jgi:amidohydrolase